MAEWNGSNIAPTGLYRVIASDTFAYEDYWIGDFADLAQTKKLASDKAGPMNPVLVFDADGKMVFEASSNSVKEG